MTETGYEHIGGESEDRPELDLTLDYITYGFSGMPVPRKCAKKIWKK